MDMIGFVRKNGERQKCPNIGGISILDEIKGIFHGVAWDVQPRPKEASMNTQAAVLLTDGWMEVKESRLV